MRGLDNPSRPRPCCTLACRGRGPTQGTCRRELTAEGLLPSMQVLHPMLCMFGVQAELPHDGKAGTFVGHLTLLHVCIAGSTPSRVGGHRLRYCLLHVCQFVKIMHKTSNKSCPKFVLCLVLCFYDFGFWRKPKALEGSTLSPCSLFLFSIATHPLAHFLRKGRGERKIYFE